MPRTRRHRVDFASAEVLPLTTVEAALATTPPTLNLAIASVLTADAAASLTFEAILTTNRGGFDESREKSRRGACQNGAPRHNKEVKI